MAYMKLGDILVAAKVLNKYQLDEALKKQKGSGQRLGEFLIDQGIIKESDFITALQRQLGIDYIDLAGLSIPIELAKYVPRAVAEKHNLVPVKLLKDTIYIAMGDPLDFVGQEEVKNSSHKKVMPLLANSKAVEESIAKLYGNEGTAKAIEDMKLEAGDVSADIVPVQLSQTSEEDAATAPTIRFVNSIISRAYIEGASDIHLEPQENEMVVRMRIDGILHKILTIQSNLQPTVISRIKVMGGMNIAERKIPQDGHAIVHIKERVIDLRISSMPTMYGEKIVIRLLDKTLSHASKQEIGFANRDLDKYNALISNSSGVILIVGPTGSGKSTTLCAMLSELATEAVNIETLEDPVEYDIKGISQCQINEKTGMTFASGLRALLRQDPDVIGVGEIRDGETGTIAMRAAITGHLVLSTLHTNDAVSTVQRLVDIGIEPYLVSSALKGVISQRLVRRVCPNCKTAYEATEDEKEFLGVSPSTHVTLYKGAGCSECHQTGYKGRRAVFEIMMVDSKVRKLISAGADYDELFEEVSKGDFITMKDACRKLVLEGQTTVSESLRAVGSTSD